MAGAAWLPAASLLPRLAPQGGRQMPAGSPNAYTYRIAFGAWINDMRTEPLPLENWPAPQFDDECVESIIRAMEVQRQAGFQMLDVWGLFATYGWPPDIVSVLDKPRRRRINRLIEAAGRRGLKLVLGLGTYSWGYDKIIEADPPVRGKGPSGEPHPHAMCDANPKAFGYVKKIIDFALSEFDFGGVHLESCDLGCCFCPSCAGKDGVVGYNVRINTKTADYIKSKWPDKIVYVITINWVAPGQHFTGEDKARVIELGKHIDCLFDQGHAGYHVAESERRQFISRLPCAYGTSGKLWLYPDARWDRSSYFLPCVKRTGEALKEQFQDGVRGCLFYQGPVSNPGTEVNIAFGGRVLSDTRRSVEDTLAEVIELYYKPKTAGARRKLVDVFLRAEEAYFSNWARQRELFLKMYGFVPGEFKLDQNLWGASPGPATFLREPMLDAAGRRDYKQGLMSILRELPELEGRCDDRGRLARIKRAVIFTLNLINTIG
jgi:hypothetical protein